MFDINKIKHVVNAETCKIGIYGYFGNSIESIRKAVTQKKSVFNVVYAKLEFVLDENYERRFGNDYGVFSLFYPLDKVENVFRY